MLSGISLRGLRRLIWVDKLRRGRNVGFLAGRFTFYEGMQGLHVVPYHDLSDRQIYLCESCLRPLSAVFPSYIKAFPG